MSWYQCLIDQLCLGCGSRIFNADPEQWIAIRHGYYDTAAKHVKRERTCIRRFPRRNEAERNRNHEGWDVAGSVMKASRYTLMMTDPPNRMALER